MVYFCLKRCGTADPFVIADQLGILYQVGNIQHFGYYMYLKKHRYIFLSDRLKRRELRAVMAHELGHALLDCKAAAPVADQELRADLFAAYLLVACALEQINRIV